MSRNDASRRRRRRMSGAAVPLSILLGSVLVWQSSESAYSMETQTGANSWAAGNATLLQLTGNNGAVTTNNVIFSVTNVHPDAAEADLSTPFTPSSAQSGGVKCVRVEYTGSAARIRLRATHGGGGTNLRGALLMRVERGTGPSGATAEDCAATFTPDATAAEADVFGGLTGAAVSSLPLLFSTGAATEWAVAGNDNAWYRISWVLPAGTTAGAGETTTTVLTWEAQVGA